ncbi:MAG: hypothetical protein R3B68_02040 [Phycisphaerales bacterium]
MTGRCGASLAGGDAGLAPMCGLARVARLLALLVIGLAATSAWSRQGGSPEMRQGRARPSVGITLGWGEYLPAERFGPIWVTIDPADQTLEGTIHLTFPQDAVQDVTLVAPFAAAAGRATTVEFAAALPPDVPIIRAEARRPNGRVIASQTLARAISRDEQPLPPGLSSYDDLVLGVGDTGLLAAARGWWPGLLATPTREPQGWGPSSRSAATDLFESTMVVEVGARALPESWIAYDGVRCVVLDARSSGAMSPAAARALRDWVWDGGRLVLLIEGSGAEWAAWVRGLGGSPIEVGEARTIGATAEMAHAAGRRDTGSAVLAPAFSARGVRLTRTGEALGWRGVWPLDPAGSGVEHAIAEGPVGLGFVAVVGVRPDDILLGVDRVAAGNLWRQVLAGAMEPFKPEPGKDDEPDYWYGQQASGDTMRSRHAITVGLDHLADVPPPSGRAFFGLAAASVLLALLLGPGDAIVLKRLRLRQHAWLTGLGWIALASVLAYAVPGILRPTDGRLGRLNVVDQVHDPSGAAVLSRQSVLTGVLSARAGRASLEADGGDGASWWRGVSSVQSFSFEPRRGMGSPVVLAVGAVEAGDGAPVRASEPVALPMPLMTFRTLLERGGGDVGLAAVIGREGDGWRVSLTGVPDGAAIGFASVEVGREGQRAVVFEREVGGDLWVATVGDTGGSSVAQRRQAERARISGGGGFGTPIGSQSWAYPGGIASTLEEALANLPGSRERGDAMDRMVRSGRWAIVRVRLDDMPMDASTSATRSERRTVLARLLVPLAEAVEDVRPAERWSPSPRVPTGLGTGSGSSSGGDGSDEAGAADAPSFGAGGEE